MVAGCLGAVGLSAAALTAVACCGGGLGLNAGTPAYHELDATWTRTDGGDTLQVAAALDEHCRRSFNGPRNLFDHLWYNAITSGYDKTVRIDGPPRTYDMVMLYGWNHRVFVRDETSHNGYHHVVMTCDEPATTVLR